MASVQDQWQGLPLMSWPTHGRDSHHETRVMRDDVMSYGDGDAVSAITLASFEDMGHYLARYGALMGKQGKSGYGVEHGFDDQTRAEIRMIRMTLADCVFLGS
jgi:hypothetical protein